MLNRISNHITGATHLKISNSRYHETDAENAVEYYKLHCNNKVIVSVDECDNYDKLVYSGRAKSLRDVTYRSPCILHRIEFNDNAVIKTVMELCANGNFSISKTQINML